MCGQRHPCPIPLCVTLPHRQVTRGEDGHAEVEHASTLTGHSKTVNCVRFSPDGRNSSEQQAWQRTAWCMRVVVVRRVIALPGVHSFRDSRLTPVPALLRDARSRPAAGIWE